MVIVDCNYGDAMQIRAFIKRTCLKMFVRAKIAQIEHTLPMQRNLKDILLGKELRDYSK